jgi:leucyl aminopeptidase
MRCIATTASPRDTAADTVAIGVFTGEGIAHDLDGAVLQGLVDAGEAKAALKHLALAHGDGRRWLLVGLGDRDRFDAERARVAAATVVGRARELGAKVLCWEVPHRVGDDVVGGLVEGTVLAAYRFRAFKSGAGGADDADAGALDELLVSAHHDVAAPVAHAATVAAAANAARDLQNTPANHMTPTHLARRAEALAGHHASLTAEVEGRDGIVARGMGAFAAVAQGTEQEPALIVLTYRGGGTAERSFPLGLVGKAVTFDTGGISLKPSAKMQDMKFDMSGGAAVIEAMGAIAELGLPIDVVAVVGATENMPSGRAIKPGDVVTTKAGLTVEVNNTDAEGRLVLADCLAYAIELGARRVVDVATLTGAMLVALGSTYTGLMSTDDALAGELDAAGRATGELVWRLPLHEEYANAVKGQFADLTNAVEGRKAGSITAAEFLKRFTGDTPWAHLDIAGTAWDTGRAYAAKAGTGTPVRLLVELTRRLAAETPAGPGD